MISCSSAFKSKIGGNVRYLKAFLVNASGTAEIKTYVLKTGGMGAERFNFGTVYIPEACIVTTEQLNVVKNEKIQIRLYVNDEKFDSVDGIDNCVVADLYANGSVKSGDLYTVTAYGYLYLNDPVLAWSAAEEIAPFSDMISKIQNLTGKHVIIKGASLTENQMQSIVSEMKVKRITEQPTVRAYLAQMAESLMGYAYESVAGDFVICHGYPSSDTTGMEANVMMEDVKQNFSISRLTCVLAEGYTGDDGNYIAAKSLSTDGTGNSEVKYRGHTTTEEQFNILKTDIISVQYSPGTLTLFGNPLIEPSDAISFTDGNGETQFIICAGEITQTFNGGLQTEIIAPEATSDADQQALDDEYAAEETERQNKQAYVKTDQLEATNATIQKLYAETAKISDLEVVNATIKKLDAETVKTIHLEAEVAKFGYVTANTVEAQYARLDKANIGTGWIDSAMIGEGVVGTVQIADGSITDAKIVELTANKITAGTLSVERLEIRGTANSIVYALNNITGALQAQNVDTLNGEILTPRSITADRIVAGAITAKEIAAGAITANHILAGAITADKLDVRDLSAISAKIGGWELLDGVIRAQSGGKCCGIGREGIAYAFFAGGTASNGSNGVFRVGHDGSLVATNAAITGNITATSFSMNQAIDSVATAKFDVSSSGLSVGIDDGEGWGGWITATKDSASISGHTVDISSNSGNVYIHARSGIGISTSQFIDMTGEVTIHGPLTINGGSFYQGNDAADWWGGRLNNLVIESWWGISFTTNCGGQAYSGTTAVGIDCRNGSIRAGGDISTAGGLDIQGGWMDLKYNGTHYGSIFVNNGTNGALSLRSSNNAPVDIMSSYGTIQCVNENWSEWAVLKAKQFAVQSSKRYKTNIVDMTEDRANLLLSMRPVSYDYTVMGCEKDQLGMIAEEVDAVDKFALGYDEYGRPDSLDYSKFVPQLIKLCQIQQREIDNLKEMVGLTRASA